MSLEHLFDADLEYRPGMSPVANDGEGELIGSGDGVVRGERLDGTFRWTLFEQPGTLVCSMNPVLAIVTRDRPCDTRWSVAATLRFETDDERYAWLNGRLALWDGEFDAAKHRASYRAYLAERETR